LQLLSAYQEVPMQKAYAVMLLGWATAVGVQGDIVDEADAVRARYRAGEKDLTEQWNWRGRMQTDAHGWQPMRFYQRLSAVFAKDWRLWLLTEKDPGERLWNDYTSFYMEHSLPRLGIRVTAGDLRPGFAQGLVWGRSPVFGGMALPQRRRDSRNLGKRSSAESGAIRGLAWRWQRGKWRTVWLVGQGRWDGRLDGAGRVVGLRLDGEHISPTQLAGRGVLGSWITGGRLAYIGSTWQLGTVWLGQRLDRPLDLSGGKPWAFVGRGQSMAGIDGQWRWRAVAVYGEFAADPRRGNGLSAGLRWQRGKRRRTSLALQVRRYSPGFRSFYGGGLSATDATNEEGLSFAYKNRQGRWRLHLFADSYRRLRPLVSGGAVKAKVVGGVGLGLVGGVWDAEVLYRRNHGWRRVGRWYTDQVRWTGARRFGRTKWTARAASKRVVASGGAVDYGGLVSGRVDWGQTHWHGILHLSFAAVSAYASRVYEYEPGLPGTFGVRAFYRRGGRLVLLGARSWGRLRATGQVRGESSAEGVEWRLAGQLDLALSRQRQPLKTR
jgi:hypothetical protein